MADIAAWGGLSRDCDKENTRKVIGKIMEELKGTYPYNYGGLEFHKETARCIKRSDLTPGQKGAATALCQVLSSTPDDDCLKCACFMLDAIISGSCKSTVFMETVTIYNVYKSKKKGPLCRNVSEEAYKFLSSNDGFLCLVHQYSNGRISTAPREHQTSPYYTFKVLSEYCTCYAVRSREQNAAPVRYILLACPTTFNMR